jgi:hypothetical protein
MSFVGTPGCLTYPAFSIAPLAAGAVPFSSVESDWVPRQQNGTIRVERRPSLLDLVRRYTVFIDQQPAGTVHALQKASFPVPVGEHRVQLRIVNTGSSASPEFVVDVRSDETRVLRTHRLTSKQYLEAPLGIVAPDEHAPRPWIGMQLLDR